VALGTPDLPVTFNASALLAISTSKGARIHNEVGPRASHAHAPFRVVKSRKGRARAAP